DPSLDDNYEMAAPVGSFPKGKSVYGAEDMAGNVWEWCLDWWDKDYYETSPAQNPTGPQSGEFKVIRGGSWFSDTDGARTAQRMYFGPARGSAAIGFRCAKDTG
ncbi:MAG: SUMF1/EgtB/PvdO family nonheme iron enzyme, partial [Candidatus Hydrogenedentota bacterium]